MDTLKIKQYLKQAPEPILSSLIGEDNKELLIECNFNNVENVTSRENLVNMLIALKKEKMFEDPKVRLEIVKRLTDDEIKELSQCMKIKYEDGYNREEIQNEFLNKTWKLSKSTALFLQMFNINPEEYFKKEKNVYEDSVEEINLGIISENNKRFFELQDYQFIVKQRTLNRLENKSILKRMLIRMPTGTGKTKTSMHVITEYFINAMKNEGIVLWIADRRELLEQAVRSFKNVWEHLGNKNIKIYRLWDMYDFDKEQINDGIIFTSIQKLRLLKNTEKYEQIHRKVKLIIYDEAHKALAKETKTILEDLMHKHNDREKDRSMIGLTATPGRNNEIESIALSRMFDNYSIEIAKDLLDRINLTPNEYANIESDEDIIKYLQSRGVLAKLQTKRLEYDTISNEEKLIIKEQIEQINDNESDIPIKLIEKIGENKFRNKAILEELKELNEKGIPTIVFACSVEHGKRISAILTMNDIKNVAVYGETSSEERKKYIRKFKNNEVKILINYDVLTTGFDSTNIRCVFITRPTSSIALYSQMIGRGLRGPKMGGNEVCQLIDIKDNLEQYNEKLAFNHFNKYWRR